MTDPRLRFLGGVAGDDGEILDVLDNTTVRVTATAPLSELRHQVLLLVLVDLLGRVMPRLDVQIDPSTSAAKGLPPGSDTVGERIEEIRRRSPLAPAEPDAPAVSVHIGAGSASADIYVDGSEWQSYLGSVPSRLTAPRRECAIGPLAAACRAAATAFAIAFAALRGAPSVEIESYRSALTHRCNTDPIADPYPDMIGPLDLLLVGAGSIGGAAALAMRFEAALAGSLIVCDPQNLEGTNPYRAIGATAAAAAAARPKAAEVAAALAHHDQLCVDDQALDIADWEATLEGPPPLPLVLVAVDRLESRELIQDALPFELVNAAANGDELAVSGHRTGTGPCVCCLHMGDVLDSTKIKNRLIADAVGMSVDKVNEFRVRSVGLAPDQLRRIEAHRQLSSGALEHFVNHTLDDLYNAEIRYGETEVETSGGTRHAVTAPFITALAGILLAGEAFKRATPSLTSYALGPDGPAIRYWENPYSSHYGWIDPAVERSPVCICRSTRRLEATADLYRVDLRSLLD